MGTEILALIPARSGSKSIKDKNIRICAGMPLLAYSILSAQKSKRITRVIVSTDSPLYATIARSYGAETPFLRPRQIAEDHSTDLEVFTHALQWLADNESYIPETCVHLRPTYPVRKVEDIEHVIRILQEDEKIDSVRTVSPALETPYKMWTRSSSGFLREVANTSLPEAYNLPRQVLPIVYIQNACIDAVRTSVILHKRSMTGDNIFGYVMNHNFDVDEEFEFTRTEAILKNAQSRAGLTG